MSTVKSTDPTSPDFLKIDSASAAAGAGVDVGILTDYLDRPTSTPPAIGAFAVEGGGSVLLDDGGWFSQEPQTNPVVISIWW